jgi:hypothetical protein
VKFSQGDGLYCYLKASYNAADTLTDKMAETVRNIAVTDLSAIFEVF